MKEKKDSDIGEEGRGDPYKFFGFPLFDKLWSDTEFIEEESSLVLDALHDRDKVLDIGVGVGAVSQRLVNAGKQVTGVDTYPGIIEYVKRKIDSPNFAVDERDATHLGYEGEFDAAVSTSTIGYVQDPSKFIREAYNALKPEGLLVITGYQDHERHTELNLGQTLERVENDEIELNEEEREKVHRLVSETPASSLEDSLERSRGYLADNGFRIRESRLFYHDTCYIIVAEKQAME